MSIKKLSYSNSISEELDKMENEIDNYNANAQQ